MKHTLGWLSLVTSLLFSASAQAQTENPQDLPVQVAVARCAYAASGNACQEVRPTGDCTPEASGNTTVAQIPRRMPGPPMGPRRTMGPPPPYPGMWAGSGSGRHAAIGAVIGFGLGAAIGAKGNGGVRGSVAVGAIVGLLGAAMGASIPSFRSRRYHSSWPDEDEMAARKMPLLSRPTPPAIASRSEKGPNQDAAIQTAAVP